MATIKYAVPYTRSFRHYDTVDEVVFDFVKDANMLDILSAVNLKHDQRIIVDMSNINSEDLEKYIPSMEMLMRKHPKCTFSLDFMNHKSQVSALKNKNIPFMFATFVRSLDTAYAMINMGATDLYIVEELAFNLKSLQHFREQSVMIRLFPDIAQCGRGSDGLIPEVTKFWIRPEDVQLYADYVDVLEIYHKDNVSTIYEIYNRKQWLGNIQDIVYDFKDELPNTGIAPHFGQARLNCRKQCLENKCSLCLDIYNLAKTFNQANIEIIKKRDKNSNLNKRTLSPQEEEIVERLEN